MSFAYMPLYTGDYQRDTLHLSMLEHGAYLKLLMYCWDQQGPAPHDERKLMGICNARSKEEITAMQCVLAEFFIKMVDGWHNQRLAQELAKAEESVIKAQDRGKKSAEARRQKYGTAQPFESVSKGFRKEPESVPNSPTPTPTPEKTITTLSGKPDVMPQAIALLEKLNEATGNKFQPVAANISLIKGRLAEYTFDDLSAMIDAKVNEWRHDDKLRKYLRPKTLFNATNCAQYVGEIGATVSAESEKWWDV